MIPFSVPVQPDAATALQWAHEELARAQYHPQQRWYTRILQQIWQMLFGPTGSNSRLLLYLCLGVLVTAVLLAVVKNQRQLAHSSTARATKIFSDPPEDAWSYFQQMSQAGQEGEWAAGVVAGLRFLIRHLEEVELIPERPGRTVNEAASAAGRIFPAQHQQLRQTARYFDAAFYAHRPLTQAAFNQVMELVQSTIGVPQPGAQGVKS